MSRNIKEIGKELMGKSLNSFHRKTGLTQLEENNKMQDGILDGILSQVDDAYIEKTEQSNVMHLDGSGDGVVVLDSIEGNTLVNLLNFNDIRKGGENYNCLSINSDNKSLSLNSNLEFNNRYQYFRVSNITLHSNKEYTFVCNITKNTFSKTFEIVPYSSRHTNRKGTNGDGSHYLKVGQTGIHKYTFTMVENDIFHIMYADSNAHFNSGEVEIINPMILEGDWSDKEIPASYFEGLQSSFEDKVEEDKYKIEILSNNENLFNSTETGVKTQCFIKKGTKVVASHGVANISNASIQYFDKYGNKIDWWTLSQVADNRRYRRFTILEDAYYFMFYNGDDGDLKDMAIKVGDGNYNYIPHKSNKIKLLMNEPLRGLPTGVKDRFVKIGGKLFIERKCGGIILDGSENTIRKHNASDTYTNTNLWRFENLFNTNAIFNDKMNMGICDKFEWNANTAYEDFEHCRTGYNDNLSTHVFYIWLNKSKCSTVDEFRTWMSNNPATVVYQLAEPYYEEVLNEYGEPILLEGYENGTIYIDSTIVPTTTVRYTPKMESFRTLKEVENNNIMLTNDVNDNIIPYMMDVDLMIMEKEMALMSHKNIRTIGVKDMTSMQKRTQDMLERLIKGKTLTEQECKTRVAVYLNAGKITDEQAKELNFLIDEIYA